MEKLINNLENDKNQTEALKSFAKEFKDAAELLARIETQLKLKPQQAINEPRNWGHAGSMEHTKNLLREVLFSLGGISEEEAEKYGI